MTIRHVALWTRDLQEAAAFWVEHFGAAVGPEYVSRNRPGFRSRFVTLPEGGQIELMTGPWVEAAGPSEREGWAHIAIGVGSEGEVRRLAQHFAALGRLRSGPRVTGDGYYEAVIEGPGTLLIEITV
jgi:lactoylglutathione lyase